jgi:hypothetical protein
LAGISAAGTGANSSVNGLALGASFANEKLASRQAALSAKLVVFFILSPDTVVGRLDPQGSLIMLFLPDSGKAVNRNLSG